MKRKHQLELSFFTDGGMEGQRFILTRALQAHRLHKQILKKLSYVLRFFPELHSNPVKVGLTRAASGMAIPGGKSLWFNPAQISYHTIAHELVHLLQGSNNMPKGERSCDLHALARHWTLNDMQPCYVKIPKIFIDESGKILPSNAKIIYLAAVEGLRIRDEGKRNYISHFEKSLQHLAHSK